eukprot:TRINITY_DN22963_c0_g1_i2.p1 TRINITY_DN22963_c0_g1~~TRINITY_DN22963_c0_g1_i2.p1  ORF type:complete len:517 (-),score=64.37 TRINITY_DN22963_c0_g1_i2:98-1648(-)
MMRPSGRCLALLDGVAVGSQDVGNPVARLGAFALARLALRSAREGRASISLWRAIAVRAKEVSGSMQPMDMSTVAFSFAKMRLRDKAMMASLAESSPAILGQFRAADITFFLAAFARLDVHHRLIFNLFAREIAHKLHDFSAGQLGEIVYAYARLGLKHDLLLDVLKSRIIEVSKAMKPWHLAMVVNGFARLGISDERFFTVIAAEICRRITEFSGQPLALVANAYARLGVRNRFLLELLADEAFRRRGELEPQSVALILNAHARLGFASPVLYDFFAQDVPRRIKRYSIQSLCLVASAYARQRRAEEPLFEKIGNFACENALQLYPRAVATLLYSFSEVDIRHSVLFFNVPKHVAQHIAAYSVDELAMVARAYGRFQMVHLQLFDTLTEALPSRELLAKATQGMLQASQLDSETGSEQLKRLPRVASLVNILEAYARLTIYEADILQLLCDTIVARQRELAVPLVPQVVRSLAALAYPHRELLDIATAVMEEVAVGRRLDEPKHGCLGSATGIYL